MQPIIAAERGSNPMALWIPKLAGELLPGDHRTVQVTFHGRVEIRLSNDVLALCFQDVYMEYSAAAHGLRTSPPQLHLFLTEKKAKTRMVDIHTQGTPLPWNQQTAQRILSTSPCTFSQTLKAIVDVRTCKGLVIAKLPDTPPKTADAIVYAYAVLVAPKSDTKSIESALAMHDIRDLLSIPRNSAGKTASAPLSPSSPLSKQPSRASRLAGTVDQQSASSLHKDGVTENADLLKLSRPLPEYTKLALRAWRLLGLAEDKTISYTQYEQALQALELFIFAPHARRLFLAFDTAEEGNLDMSQLEALLIANDLLGAQLDLTLVNAFAIFSSDGKSSQATISKSTSVDGGQLDARSSSTATDALNSTSESGGAGANQGVFRWLRGKKDKEQFEREHVENFTVQNTRLLNHGTLDFSAFVEVLDTIGYQLPEGDLHRAFTLCTEGKEENVIRYNDFKQLFMQLCDVEKELIRLGHAKEARRTESVAKTLLHRVIEENEKAYIAELAEAPVRVARLRQSMRQARDLRRRQRVDYADKRARQIAHRQAAQNQEKRLANKLQQEQRGKQREQDRKLRKQLMESQTLNRQQQQMALKAQLAEKESKASADARAKGYDRLDLSNQALQHISRSMYIGRDAQKRLAWIEVLDLSRNKLATLPDDRFLYSMPMLRKLVLESNRLKYLPEEVESIPSLQILDVSNNQLKWLPSGLSKLSQLERLAAANNFMTSLMDLSNCTELQYLAAHSNKLRSVDAGIGSLKKLQYLDLANNDIHRLPEELSDATSLTYLNLRGNRLGHLPQKFGQLQQLQLLDISINSIAFLPKSCTDLRQLELCLAERNAISDIKCTVLFSSKLMELFMPNNSVTALPTDLMHCTCLQHICLRQNQLTAIAPEIGLLRELQSLDVACNLIAELPAEFGSCSGLQHCNMSRNRIVGALPDTVGLLSSLLDLDLAHNRISFIPENFGGLSLLTKLNLAHNDLDAPGLPKSLTMLSSLTHLDLSHNSMTRFPIQLVDIAHLTTLELGANAISLLPENMQNLSKLQKLGLESNTLQALPPTFVALWDSIPEISLEHNIWSSLPAKWGQSHMANLRSCGYSVEDVIHFTRAMHSIHSSANKTWMKFGAECFSGRMSFQEFESLVKRQAPLWYNESHNALVYYYAQAKRHGIPPVLSDDIVAIAHQTIAIDYQKAQRGAALATASEAMKHLEEADTDTDMQHLRARSVRGSHSREITASQRAHLTQKMRQEKLRAELGAKAIAQSTRAAMLDENISGQYAKQLHEWSQLATYTIEDNVDPTLEPLAFSLGTGGIGYSA